MREIKFRAWDKKSHKMREIDSIAFHKKSDPFDLGSSNTPKVINVWGYDCIEQEDIILHREENEVELMQSTGLKDKNGVEIYDGDIYHQGDRNILYIVVWHDTGFIGKQARASSYAGLEFWKGRIKVIGNIYENPNLLEEPHED